MDSPADNQPAGDTPSRSWQGYAWAAFLAVGLIWFEYRQTPRDVLDLRETAVSDGIIFGLPLLVLVPFSCVVWFCEGIGRVARRRRAPEAPWLQLGMVAVVIGAIVVKREVYVPPCPVLPESEPVYLQIAMVAREELAKPEINGSLSLDLRWEVAGEVRSKARDRLERMLPDYWRRSLLWVSLDDDCVVLSRGSGMLGRVGVRIYDRGPAVIYREDELHENPHLPAQQRITERLWVFASD